VKSIDEQIKEKREELHNEIDEAAKKGMPLNNESALKVSGELDKLIVEKMRGQIK